MKFLRFLLFPFAIIYDVITTVRNFFFDVGFFKETSFKIPVIVVGNLSVGGTGKTPQIEYLIRFLKDTSKIAVLSRGYKRKTKGFILLNETHSAEEVGDEPLQYFKKFVNIDVAVDKNRVEGLQRLIAEKSSKIVLLDDGYQHRKVKASFTILLTKYNDLFVDDFLLPTGNLRERRIGAKRATMIIVTKCPSNLNSTEQELIHRKLESFKKPVFFSTISYAHTLKGTYNIAVNQLKEYEVLLVTGIANPIPLLEYLEKKEIRFQHLKFSDHHHFTSKEILLIKKKFIEFTSSKKILLTTEKDYIRLEGKLDTLSYLEIETTFMGNQKLQFDALITSHIQENQHL